MEDEIHMNPRQRLSFPLSLLLVLVGGGVAVMILISCRGPTEPMDYSDLEPEILDIQKEDIAFTFFLAATNHIVELKPACNLSELAWGRAWDNDAASAIAATNSEALLCVEQGLECSAFQEPPITNFAQPITYISPWLTLGRVLAIRSRLERRNGDLETSCDTALLAVRLDSCSRTTSEQPSLI
ncbi:MAG: hypothetical protein KJ626_09585 [Verrucomicrobia bacterium]|nr:hypothetical protein [Verrucomicrobiota bacterium]